METSQTSARPSGTPVVSVTRPMILAVGAVGTAPCVLACALAMAAPPNASAMPSAVALTALAHAREDRIGATLVRGDRSSKRNRWASDPIVGGARREYVSVPPSVRPCGDDFRTL